jgi:hypothetical protein
MKVQIVDAKRRLVLPGAKPGEHYSIREPEAGHYELAKVIPVARKPKLKASEVDALLASEALTPAMNSEELRTLTREP